MVGQNGHIYINNCKIPRYKHASLVDLCGEIHYENDWLSLNKSQPFLLNFGSFKIKDHNIHVHLCSTIAEAPDSGTLVYFLRHRLD